MTCTWESIFILRDFDL